MSKKKPYSKIVNAKALRDIEFSRRRTAKEAKKMKAPEWVTRLLAEADDLQEKCIRLSDFLWIKETKDSPILYSPEAKALPGAYRQLLVRQHKAMGAYLDILDKRIHFKWPKADHRKQRGRSEKAKKGGK